MKNKNNNKNDFNPTNLTITEYVCFSSFLSQSAHFFGREILERLIQRHYVHGETEHEDGQHNQKSAQILHQIANDDRPRTEQVMERQEIQNLYTSQQERQSETLVPTVHQCGPIFDFHEKHRGF